MKEPEDIPLKEKLVRSSLRNSGASVLGNIVGIIITIFTAGYTIRILGESLAGFIMLSQSILGFSSGIFNFGLGVAVVKDVSEASGLKEPDRIKGVLGVTSFVNFTIGLMVAAAFAILATQIIEWSKLSPSHYHDARISIYFYAIAFLVNFGMNSYQAIPSALQRYDYANIYGSVQAITTGVVQIFILIKFPSLANLALGTVIITIVQTLFLLWIVKRLLGRVYLPCWNYPHLRRLFSFSSVVFLTQGGYLLRDYVDRWILTSLKGSIALPGFVIGQNVMSRIRSFISGPFHFVFPMLSSVSTKLEKDKLFSIYDKLHWILTLTGSIAFSLICLNAYWILWLWIGKDFAEAHTYIFQLACLQGILSIFTAIPHFVSYGLGKPGNNLVEALSSGILVVVLAAILIPTIGVFGAALGQLITYGTVVFIIHSRVRKTIFPELSFVKILGPVLNGAFIGVLCFFASLSMNAFDLYEHFTVEKLLFLNVSLMLLIGLIVAYELVFKKGSGRIEIGIYAFNLLRSSFKERFCGPGKEDSSCRDML